jgi:aspartyl-tRNA(Asn)/glutamyl-tRNA(Gln) amidotransferase subunit A
MLGIVEAGKRFRDGTLAPDALVKDLLAAIRRANPPLNAFYEVFEESALQEGRQAAVELREGRDRGPLHGIPVAVKDLFDVAGRVTTCGAHPAFHPPPARADSDAVARLRAAGAVILGKTGLHEWAFGVSSNNPHFGPCRNPHDLERITGGSSGGSAAALAAGLCLGALGTDTGGSIRIPGSLCGVAGLKPTWGLVPTGGLSPLSESLDHAGPMANSVEDVFLLLEGLCDFRRRAAPKPDVLVPTGPFFDEVDPEVRRVIAEAVAKLGPSSPVDLGDVQAVWSANSTIMVSEAAALHETRLKERPDAFGPGLADRFKMGFTLTAIDYARARKVQREWTSFLDRLLGDRAVLALPATAVTATLIGDREGPALSKVMTRYTAPFNLAGAPCLVLPAGKVGALPIGLQLVAAPGRESLLYAAGRAFEGRTPRDA